MSKSVGLKLGRRKFIKSVGTVAGTVALSNVITGCTTLDEIVLGDSRDESNKIVILGGGLAGLTAAYQLKKAKVAFRVYEGSARPGGRALSVQEVNSASQSMDLGAEMIPSHHGSVINLAKELKVILKEYTPSENEAYFSQNDFVKSSEFKDAMVKLNSEFQKLLLDTFGRTGIYYQSSNKTQFPRADVLDRMSVQDLMQKVGGKLSPLQKIWITRWSQKNYGLEPAKISALHLVHYFNQYNPSKAQGYFKVGGGAQVLTNSLNDQIAGVIPGRTIRFEHKLFSIRKKSDIIELGFKTPTGDKFIFAKNVICTLPFSILRGIKGWESLGWSAEMKSLVAGMNYGTHTKIGLSFSEKFWRSSKVLSRGGSWILNLASQRIYQGGNSSELVLATGKGVLMAEIGGEEGAKGGLHSVQKMLTDLAQVQPGNLGYEKIFYIQNWALHPWSKGSVPSLKPGQFSLYSNSVQSDGLWAMAGDHMDLANMGTMQAAVDSAQRAVQHFRSEFSKLKV